MNCWKNFEYTKPHVVILGIQKGLVKVANSVEYGSSCHYGTWSKALSEKQVIRMPKRAVWLRGSRTVNAASRRDIKTQVIGKPSVGPF